MLASSSPLINRARGTYLHLIFPSKRGRGLVSLLLLAAFASGCSSTSPFAFFGRSKDTSTQVAAAASSDVTASSSTAQNSTNEYPLPDYVAQANAVAATTNDAASAIADPSANNTASATLQTPTDLQAPAPTAVAESPAALPPAIDPTTDAVVASTAVASATEFPGRLTSAAKKTFDIFRSAIPTSDAAADAALVEKISNFNRFPFSFDLPSVAGEKQSSKSFGGQLLVVDVWATWCAPCKKAIPEFIEIQKEFESQGVQVVGITCDSADPAAAAEIARRAYNIGEQLNINYPLLVDDGSTIPQIPGFRGYPTTLFVTSDGQVRYMVTGMQSKEKLTAMINAILQI